jgi:hypothetical protein
MQIFLPTRPRDRELKREEGSPCTEGEIVRRTFDPEPLFMVAIKLPP